MPPIDMNHVIVFGDSLSDIGTKWTQPMGAFAHKTGLMTVNKSGRFSDSRNWTDYMIEDATAGTRTLVYANSLHTIAASKRHLTFGKNCKIDYSLGDMNLGFNYANYAVGGACASGDKRGVKGRIGLTSFRDQYELFESGLNGWYDAKPSLLTFKMFNRHNPLVSAAEAKKAAGGRKERFLFLIWFGANDLFTANKKTADMADVAKKIHRLRAELNALVTPFGGEAYFLFMNMGSPRSTPRFNDAKFKKAHNIDDAKMEEYVAGVALFNKTLENLVKDELVDIESLLRDGAEIEQLCEKYNMKVREAADQGTIDIMWYEQAERAKNARTKMPMTTEDKVHPTSRLYEAIWEERIKPALQTKGYNFGNVLGLLGEREPEPVVPRGDDDDDFRIGAPERESPLSAAMDESPFG